MNGEWLGVGAEGVIRIVNDMRREARQWEDFASANQLQQKNDYFKGKADALDELLKVLKGGGRLMSGIKPTAPKAL